MRHIANDELRMTNMSEYPKLTIQEMHRLTTEAFHAADKLPFVAVLDNVRSRHNVGAVFRTADAFRLESVLLCGITGCPPDMEIHKTALGAEESMEWEHIDDTLQAVKLLQQRGYRVYAVEQAHHSITLSEMSVRIAEEKKDGDAHGIAVVFGHEVFGVQQEVIDLCDGCIEIPQFGTKHSLNVSVTAGIVLYTLAQSLFSYLHVSGAIGVPSGK